MPPRRWPSAPRATDQTRCAVYAAIQDAIATTGISPSVRDIQRAAGLSSTSVVTYHLDALEARGLIRRARHKARAITLATTHDWDRQRREAVKDFETIAQMVHNAYHEDKRITWRDCRMASCQCARAAIAALSQPTTEDRP